MAELIGNHADQSVEKCQKVALVIQSLIVKTKQFHELKKQSQINKNLKSPIIKDTLSQSI
jgi:hypothetical protein